MQSSNETDARMMTNYSSERRRAAGFVTLTLNTLALQTVHRTILIWKAGNENIPLKDCCAVTAADVVRNLCREAFVVHQEQVNFPHVADEELLQAVRKKMPGLKKR